MENAKKKKKIYSSYKSKLADPGALSRITKKIYNICMKNLSFINENKKA